MSLAVWQDMSERILQSGHSLESFQEDASAAALLKQLRSELASKLLSVDRKHRTNDDAASEGPALDAYFSRIEEALPSYGPALAKNSDVATRLLALVQEVASSRPCTTCATPAVDQTCRWTKLSEVSDHSILSSRGHCIRDIKSLFAYAGDVARSAYESCDVKLRHSVSLSTGHDSACGEFGTALDAQTLESGMNRRAISVSFNVEKLLFSDYLSLFYILSHEYIAHAFCGVSVDDFEAVKSGSFHEGWMDCVAASVLLGHFGQPASSSAHAHARYGADFRLHMERVRSIRFDFSRPSAPEDALQWIRGSEAYHTLLFLFEFICKEQSLLASVAVQKLNSFSLKINASDVSHASRCELVRTINTNFSRRHDEARWGAILRNPVVLAHVEEYFARGDAKQFFERLVTTRWSH